MENATKLVDTHVHVVSGDQVRYPLDRFDHPGSHWVDAAPDGDAFLDELDGAGVDSAVLVQPHGAYRFDNRYLLDVATQNPRFAAVGIVAPTPGAADEIATLATSGGAGLRLFSIPTPATAWIDADVGLAMRIAAQQADLTLGICVLPDELAAVARCADQRPYQTLVLDHCGFALDDGAAGVAVADLRALAASPNVVLKVTTHVIDSWQRSGAEIGALFPTLAEWFGSDRLVWGSDYAQTHDRTYAELVEVARAALEPMGRDAGALAATARRLWWPVGE